MGKAKDAFVSLVRFRPRALGTRSDRRTNLVGILFRILQLGVIGGAVVLSLYFKRHMDIETPIASIIPFVSGISEVCHLPSARVGHGCTCCSCAFCVLAPARTWFVSMVCLWRSRAPFLPSFPSCLSLS